MPLTRLLFGSTTSEDYLLPLIYITLSLNIDKIYINIV